MIMHPLCLPWHAAVETRRFLYRRVLRPRPRVPALAVGVGNITAGGTGKTTVAAWLARWYAARGEKVALLGHGVGGHRRRLVVSEGGGPLAGPREAGDEAILLTRMAPDIPVLSGRDRAALAAEAVTLFEAGVVVADDAFHCLGVPWDLNIVVFNSLAGLGNGRLLPLGPLRERPENLDRADLFWLNHADLVTPGQLDFLRSELLKYNPGVPFVTSRYRYRAYVSSTGERIPPGLARDRRVCLVAGIGAPETFRRKAETEGLVVVGAHFFPDHHSFRTREIAALKAGGADYFLVTEKDMTRFPAVETPVPVIYPEIALEVSGWPPDGIATRENPSRARSENGRAGSKDK